jgi:phage-related baseplate assembly protein
MAGAYTAVDLSKLPAPDVVEQLDYEAILAAMVADLQARDPAFSALVESDPAYKILEVCAYRELVIRQRVNDGARAVMLAYAGGTDLDQLAANYNVARLLIDAGDPDAVPPVPPTYEDDTSLRRRVQLSFEGFSTAGPEGAYIFHALGADADVLDASVTSPTPGDVVVTILSRTGNGAADSGLIAAVESVLSADDVRPLTDNVTVQSASIINYSVDAVLTLYPGPDSAVVLAAAQAALADYIDANHRLGRDITLSGLYAALHREGVQGVTLNSPASNVSIAANQAAYCTGTTVTVGGTDE